jgi:hypothetical protein
MKEMILKTANVKDYLTVEEASLALGIKTNAIRNYLYLGKLTTYKFKNLTLLDSREINNWKKRQK